MPFDQNMRIAILVLEYLTVLAWPTVVLIVACVFRQHILDVVARISSAEVPGLLKLALEAKIDKVEKLSEKVEEIKPPEDQKDTPRIPASEANIRMLDEGLRPSPSGLDLGYYRNIANQDPNLALAGLRIELELMIDNLVDGFDIDFKGLPTLQNRVSALAHEGAITREQNALIRKIIAVCNEAAHGIPLSRDGASQVIDSAEVLVENYVSWLSWGLDDSSSGSESESFE